MTVLLLMEQALTAEVIAVALRRSGYRVDVLDISAIPAGFLPRTQEYDVVLFDADFAVAKGSGRLWSLLDRWPGRLLALSEHPAAGSTRDAVAGRVSGFVDLDVSLDELHRAVAVVRAGRRYVPRGPTVESDEFESAPPEGAGSRGALTVRETDVLNRLARGDSTAEIARDLGISLNTTRTHVQNVLSKLGVHSRLQAAAYRDPRHGGDHPAT